MNMLKTTVLMAALMGILIAIGGAVGGSTGALVMFVVSLGMNIFMYWNSADMCLKAYGGFGGKTGKTGRAADAACMYY